MLAISPIIIDILYLFGAVWNKTVEDFHSATDPCRCWHVEFPANFSRHSRRLRGGVCRRDGPCRAYRALFHHASQLAQLAGPFFGIFPNNREFTGNFGEFCGIPCKFSEITVALPIGCERFPCASEQGILGRYQGKLLPEQGSFSREQGMAISA